jgi:3-oxoacyl-[acyl-carrier protein] reductase
MSKLSGKVAIVTGASKGIGAAIAKSLAASGASVVVNYASSKEGANKVVEAIKAGGGKAVAVKGDISKAATPTPLSTPRSKLLAASMCWSTMPAYTT